VSVGAAIIASIGPGVDHIALLEFLRAELTYARFFEEHAAQFARPALNPGDLVCLCWSHYLLRVAQRAILAQVIKSFKHKGLRRFFETGTKAGIQAKHAGRLRLQLAALDTAQVVEDMEIPGYRLHALKGRAKDRWSIWVSGNWRLTFEFKDGNAYVLDYEDYH
tara:strand:+ start:136 stop:627 length:492 start_codon:yes stop_codon:yes gene_type:complete